MSSRTDSMQLADVRTLSSPPDRLLPADFLLGRPACGGTALSAHAIGYSCREACIGEFTCRVGLFCQPAPTGPCLPVGALIRPGASAGWPPALLAAPRGHSCGRCSTSGYSGAGCGERASRGFPAWFALLRGRFFLHQRFGRSPGNDGSDVLVDSVDLVLATCGDHVERDGLRRKQRGARDQDLHLRLRPLPGLESSFCELGEKTARSARSEGFHGTSCRADQHPDGCRRLKASEHGCKEAELRPFAGAVSRVERRRGPKP